MGSSANGGFGVDRFFFLPGFWHSGIGHPPAQGWMTGNAGVWKLQVLWWMRCFK